MWPILHPFVGVRRDHIRLSCSRLLFHSVGRKVETSSPVPVSLEYAFSNLGNFGGCDYLRIYIAIYSELFDLLHNSDNK